MLITVLLACIKTLSKGYVFQGQGQSDDRTFGSRRFLASLREGESPASFEREIDWRNLGRERFGLASAPHVIRLHLQGGLDGLGPGCFAELDLLNVKAIHLPEGVVLSEGLINGIKQAFPSLVDFNAYQFKSAEKGVGSMLASWGLKGLGLSGPGVTPEFLSELFSSPNALEGLCLSIPNSVDAHLRSLAQASPCLRWLTLNGENCDGPLSVLNQCLGLSQFLANGSVRTLGAHGLGQGLNFYEPKRVDFISSEVSVELIGKVKTETKSLTINCLAQLSEGVLQKIADHLPNLESLDLFQANLGGNKLADLTGLQQLKKLDLSSTRPSDPEAIVKFQSLESLRCEDCPWVNDSWLEGVADSAMLPNLKVLGIRQDAVTARAAEQFRANRPGTRLVLIGRDYAKQGGTP